MKVPSTEKKNSSEKGMRGALATKRANADRAAAAERERQVIKSGKARKAALLEHIPPFCFLTAGQSPEAAAAEAFKHFSMTPVEALGLVWKLRAVQQADRLLAEEQAHRAD